jgi:putative peptidoglycan lipid II flippase
MRPLGHVGLALATSAGVWINVMLLAWFARRKSLIGLDDRARRVLPRLFLAFGVLCAALVLVGLGLKAVAPGLNEKLLLVALMGAGGLAYGGALVALFGKDFLADLKRLRRGVAG